MNTRPRAIAALALLPLALSACGGGDDAADTSSSSSSVPSSASASPSKSATPSATSASATPTETPTTEATEAAPAVPDPTEAAAAEPTQAAAAPEQAQGPAAPTVRDYFAAGGGCIADVWNAGDIPYSEALAEQVYAYCDANNLGDWAGDLDPRDPANLGNPEDHAPAAEDPAPPSWEECSALDQNTATSGEIQSCNMAYGYGNY